MRKFTIISQSNLCIVHFGQVEDLQTTVKQNKCETNMQQRKKDNSTKAGDKKYEFNKINEAKEILKPFENLRQILLWFNNKSVST